MNSVKVSLGMERDYASGVRAIPASFLPLVPSPPHPRVRAPLSMTSPPVASAPLQQFAARKVTGLGAEKPAGVGIPQQTLRQEKRKSWLSHSSKAVLSSGPGALLSRATRRAGGLQGALLGSLSLAARLANANAASAVAIPGGLGLSTAQSARLPGATAGLLLRLTRSLLSFLGTGAAVVTASQAAGMGGTVLASERPGPQVDNSLAWSKARVHPLFLPSHASSPTASQVYPTKGFILGSPEAPKGHAPLMGRAHVPPPAPLPPYTLPSLSSSPEKRRAFPPPCISSYSLSGAQSPPRAYAALPIANMGPGGQDALRLAQQRRQHYPEWNRVGIPGLRDNWTGGGSVGNGRVLGEVGKAAEQGLLRGSSEPMVLSREESAPSSAPAVGAGQDRRREGWLSGMRLAGEWELVITPEQDADECAKLGSKAALPTLNPAVDGRSHPGAAAGILRQELRSQGKPHARSPSGSVSIQPGRSASESGAPSFWEASSSPAPSFPASGSASTAASGVPSGRGDDLASLCGSWQALDVPAEGAATWLLTLPEEGGGNSEQDLVSGSMASSYGSVVPCSNPPSPPGSRSSGSEFSQSSRGARSFSAVTGTESSPGNSRRYERTSRDRSAYRDFGHAISSSLPQAGMLARMRTSKTGALALTHLLGRQGPQRKLGVSNLQLQDQELTPPATVHQGHAWEVQPDPGLVPATGHAKASPAPCPSAEIGAGVKGPAQGKGSTSPAVGSQGGQSGVCMLEALRHSQTRAREAEEAAAAASQAAQQLGDTLIREMARGFSLQQWTQALQLENMRLMRLLAGSSLPQITPTITSPTPWCTVAPVPPSAAFCQLSPLSAVKQPRAHHDSGAEGGALGEGEAGSESQLDLSLLLLALTFALGLTAGIGGSALVGWRCGVIVLGTVA